MFKKPNRAKNIRRKVETSDDESKEEPVVANTPLKSKADKKKTKKSLGLSFDQQDEDDAGEVFQVKKSKASRKMTTERKLHLPESSGLTANAQETPSTYNDDYLASLRANTPALPTSLKHTMTTTADDDDSALLAEKFPKTMNARLGGVAIPDSNAIHAAKKKRELLRQGVVVVDNEQDFIGVESTTGSRLVREEDDVGDDGEGEFEQYVGQQITLDKDEAKKQEQAQRQDAQDMILDAQEDDDSDSDDQMDRWERDLIKHGGVRAKYEEQAVDPYATPRGYKPALVPDASPLPSLDDVLKRLDLISTDITYSMRQYESQLSDAQKGMLDLKVTGEHLDREIQHGSDRYDYFQSLSTTVNDLGEFLDVKIPLLEQLENETHDIIAAKQQIVQDRRWLDDMDLLLSFASVPGHLLETDEDVAMDEFGRTPESKFSETSRRRRQGERQDRLQKHTGWADEADAKEAAYWSDDDLQGGWLEKKDQKLDDIQGPKLETLLEDVGNEFKTLEAVKSYFEAWKTEFYEDYKNAFGSLSLPVAFEFYIRCELVAWDPFSNPLEFDAMKWHSTLSSYGIVDGLEGHEDADIELLNKVVEKVVLKRIKNLLDTMNPISSQETRYAVHAVEQISYYVEKHERPFQDLMIQVEKTIERPLLRYAALTESATLLANEPHNNKQQFIWRQLKYLKNLALWRRYIPQESLLSLGRLIVHRIVMPLLKPNVIPGDIDLENEALALYARLE